MKRRDFFTKLGLTAAAAVVAPSVVKAATTELGHDDQEWEEVTVDKPLYQVDVDNGYVRKVGQEHIVNIWECRPHDEFVEFSTKDNIRMGDVIEIPAQYTNKDIPTMWLAKGPIGILIHNNVTAFRAIPFDVTVKMVIKMPRGAWVLRPGTNYFIDNPQRNN